MHDILYANPCSLFFIIITAVKLSKRCIDRQYVVTTIDINRYNWYTPETTNVLQGLERL